MDASQQKVFEKYIDILLRKHRIILLVLLASICLGLGLYLKLPKIYESTALIMYEQQKINPSKMSPDQQRRTTEMVDTVSQQVTSRAILEELIKQFNLYSDLLQKLPIEDVIAMMREKHISIKSEARKGDVFSVSYKGSDPKKVMLVTNALASKFIEENLRYREERVIETSAYIEDELGMAKATLDKKEAVMRDYKLKYYNEMPEQKEANINRLNALQQQYQNSQTNLHEQEKTRLLMQEQISLRKDLISKQMRENQKDGSTELIPVYDEATEFHKLTQQIEALLAKYTEEHPDVKRLRKRIEQLSSTENTESKPQGKLGDSGSSGSKDPQIEKLTMQLKEIEFSLSALKNEQQIILDQIKKYQQWVDAVPTREAEWSSLTRDYEELRKFYENLVAQSLTAGSAESLELRQKGSQFKVVDSAYLPESPVTPDFKKIMLLAIVLGVGLGAGLVLVGEFFDTSFKNATDLENYTGLPVVCSIPMVLTAKEIHKQKIISILWGGFFSVMFFVLLVGGGLLWRKGIIVF